MSASSKLSYKLVIALSPEIVNGIDKHLNAYTAPNRAVYIRNALIEHLRAKGVKIDGSMAYVPPVAVMPVVSAAPPAPAKACNYNGCHTPKGNKETCLKGTTYEGQFCPCACHAAS